jgi:predicted PurR-regulated permease PerM
MDRGVQILIALLAIVLVASLVPLLLQLYRTAKALEALAASAQEDLRQIAQDVHQTRLQLERVGGLAEQGLQFPAAASSLAGALTRSLTGPSVLPWIEAVVTGLKIALDFFLRHRKDAAPKEEKNE